MSERGRRTHTRNASIMLLMWRIKATLKFYKRKFICQAANIGQVHVARVWPAHTHSHTHTRTCTHMLKRRLIICLFALSLLRLARCVCDSACCMSVCAYMCVPVLCVCVRVCV